MHFAKICNHLATQTIRQRPAIRDKSYAGEINYNANNIILFEACDILSNQAVPRVALRRTRLSSAFTWRGVESSTTAGLIVRVLHIVLELASKPKP